MDKPNETAANDFCIEGSIKVIVRGIHERPAVGAFEERLPTAQELMELPVEARIEAIWVSGVRPLSPEMKRAFLSCAGELGRGVFIAMAAQGDAPPARMFHEGEQRDDSLVWPEGYPTPLRKRGCTRNSSKRTTERAMRAFYQEFGLFKRLSCGCLDQCSGAAWHAEVEAIEEAREQELREQHAVWDAARDRARRDLADELARVTLNETLDTDTRTEFDVLLALPTEP